MILHKTLGNELISFPGNATICQEGQFECANKKCIPKKWFCDGERDCLDGSDELCSTQATAHTKCPGTQFQCSDGRCIDERYRCDGDKDCPVDGSDEMNCREYLVILDSR